VLTGFELHYAHRHTRTAHTRCWHTNTHTHTHAHAERFFRNARVLCLVVVVVVDARLRNRKSRNTHATTPPGHYKRIINAQFLRQLSRYYIIIIDCRGYRVCCKRNAPPGCGRLSVNASTDGMSPRRSSVRQRGIYGCRWRRRVAYLIYGCTY